MADLEILSETEVERPNGEKVRAVIAKEPDGRVVVLAYAGERMFFRQRHDPATKKPFTQKSANEYLTDLVRLMTEKHEKLPEFLGD